MITKCPVVHNSTGNVLADCMAYYGNLAPIMNHDDEKIYSLFNTLYDIDEVLAVRFALYMRDARGGNGRRFSFRKILQVIEAKNPKLVIKLIPYIPNYGRYDDLLYFKTDEVFKHAAQFLFNEIKSGNSLAAKWMPRKIKTNKGNLDPCLRLRHAWGMFKSPKAYRKFLVNATDVVETKVCSKKFNEIEYDKIPSLATTRHLSTFYKFDLERYTDFIKAVKSGEKQINVNADYPHQLVDLFQKEKVDEQAINVIFDKMCEKRINERAYTKDILCMADVSGSMEGTPMNVSLGLSTIIARTNTNEYWKDKILTFTNTPRLFDISGKSFTHAIDLLSRQVGYNTNLDKALYVVLQAAIQAKTVPEYIVILTDMQFDSYANCSTTTLYEKYTSLYEQNNLKVPKFIFWNCSQQSTVTFQSDTNTGCIHISGFESGILANILNNIDDIADITKLYLKIINNDRYDIPDILPKVSLN